MKIKPKSIISETPRLFFRLAALWVLLIYFILMNQDERYPKQEGNSLKVVQDERRGRRKENEFIYSNKLNRDLCVQHMCEADNNCELKTFFLILNAFVGILIRSLVVSVERNKE